MPFFRAVRHRLTCPPAGFLVLRRLLRNHTRRDLSRPETRAELPVPFHRHFLPDCSGRSFGSPFRTIGDYGVSFLHRRARRSKQSLRIAVIRDGSRSPLVELHLFLFRRSDPMHLSMVMIMALAGLGCENKPTGVSEPPRSPVTRSIPGHWPVFRMADMRQGLSQRVPATPYPEIPSHLYALNPGPIPWTGTRDAVDALELRPRSRPGREQCSRNRGLDLRRQLRALIGRCNRFTSLVAPS